eukprot:scaffold21349_cov66-Phaeocystis_antarctica.AAC.1
MSLLGEVAPLIAPLLGEQALFRLTSSSNELRALQGLPLDLASRCACASGVGAALHAARPRLTHREGLSPESNGWPDAAWPRQRAFWKRAPLAASKPFDRLAAATRARRRVGPRPVARCAVRRPRDTRAAQVCRANRRGAARRGAAVALPRAAQSHCAHRPGAALLRRGVLAAGEPRAAGLPPAARRGEPWRAAGARGGAPHVCMRSIRPPPHHSRRVAHPLATLRRLAARREQLRRPGGPLAPGQLRPAAAAARHGLHQAALRRRAGALQGAAHRLLHRLREPAGRGAPRRVRRATHAPPRPVQCRA